jgi:hypothetical protein
MVILFEMGDLLLELFPTASSDPQQLPAILADAYAIGPFKPRVTIDGNLVRVQNSVESGRAIRLKAATPIRTKAAT